MALGHLSGIPAHQVWVAPVLGLIAVFLGYWIESVVALHSLSRYCDGVELLDPFGHRCCLPITVVALVASAAQLGAGTSSS